MNISNFFPENSSSPTKEDCGKFQNSSDHILAISNPKILEHIKGRKKLAQGSTSSLLPRIRHAETNCYHRVFCPRRAEAL